jgi:hypothetical protein
MNETDRKLQYLKTIRVVSLIDNNLNILFLLIFWQNKYVVVFWIYFVLAILSLLGSVIFVRKLEQETGVGF